MNSAFPNNKNLAQRRNLFMTNKFESKCLEKFYVSSRHEKECYMKTTSYLKERNRHFCQHYMRKTTQQTFSAINLASQQKTTNLFFSSQVRKQFKLLAVPFKSLRCCLRSDKLGNCHVTLLAEAFPLSFSALYCHSLRCFGCSRFVLVVSVPRKRPLQTAVWDSC